MYVALKPLNERRASGQQIIARIRKKVASQTGLSLYLQAQQDLRIGGRQANAEYQYTLVGDDLDLLNRWAPRLLARLHAIPELTDVSSDQQNGGISTNLDVGRDTASQLGLSMQAIDDTLAAHTTLRVTQRRELRAHYARTLHLWRERFTGQWQHIQAQGFTETFRRMWEFYLAYAEAGFRSGYLGVSQLQMTREPAWN